MAKCGRYPHLLWPSHGQPHHQNRNRWYSWVRTGPGLRVMENGSRLTSTERSATPLPRQKFQVCSRAERQRVHWRDLKATLSSMGRSLVLKSDLCCEDSAHQSWLAMMWPSGSRSVADGKSSPVMMVRVAATSSIRTACRSFTDSGDR